MDGGRLSQIAVENAQIRLPAKGQSSVAFIASRKIK